MKLKVFLKYIDFAKSLIPMIIHWRPKDKRDFPISKVAKQIGRRARSRTKLAFQICCVCFYILLVSINVS